MINLIYDKLANNNQAPQFDCESVENMFLNYRTNTIEFDSNEKHYIITITQAKSNLTEYLNELEKQAINDQNALSDFNNIDESNDFYYYDGIIETIKKIKEYLKKWKKQS